MIQVRLQVPTSVHIAVRIAAIHLDCTIQEAYGAALIALASSTTPEGFRERVADGLLIYRQETALDREMLPKEDR